ncbi:MAG: gliding motility-associated C-terminal domain-containing protein [Saprospiraceae bacterium]|nr:gliding motility-associated C-terminal domain-containing protein [Saprospiraceae bacterium]
MRPYFTLLLFLCWAVAFSQPCDFNLGPNITVCNNASFQLNKNGPQVGSYTWAGPAGLSCYNCPSPMVTGLTTGVYTYIATLQTPQCTQSDTITITVVNGQQPQYTISPNKVLCAGQSTNLGGPGFPNTFYQWSSVPPGFISSLPNPSVAPLQTTTYYLVAVNPTCPFPSTDSVKITVFQQPVLAVQGDTAICIGESVRLANTVPEPNTNYSWTPNNGTLDTATVANPVATPQQTTTYILTASNPGCIVNRAVQVTVINFDLQLNQPDTVQTCKGVPLTIQATLTPPGGVVTWAPLNSLQVAPNGLSAIATPSVPTLYSASATVPGCIRTRYVFVQVDSLPPDLNIQPSDTTICFGSQVTLVSTLFEPFEYPNIRFEWIPAAGQLTPDSLYNMVVQPDTTTLYQRITRNGTCVDTSEAFVKVIPPAEMFATPDTIICPGQSVILNTTFTPGVTNIEWSPAESLSCTTCNSPIATPSASTTYTVKGEFQGCPTSATAVVNIRPLPIIQFPANTQICSGQSVLLNQAFDPSATYNWTSTDPAFAPTANPQPVATPTLPTTTYFVTANNGCPAQGQITLTLVNIQLTVSNDTTVCRDFPVLLSASGSVPGTYVWSTGQTGQAIEVRPNATTTYTVTYTANNCQITRQITVTVDGMGPDIAFPNDTELCPGESVTLNNIATPGATYTWTSTPPGFTFNGAIPPPVSPNQTTRYNLTATLGNCTINTSVNVVVYNATLTISPNQNLCAGESVTLTANGSLSGEYLWSSGQTTPSITVSPSQTTTYDVVYTYGDGCTLEAAVQVTAVPNFTLNIAANPDTNRINIGAPISLRAVVAPSQNLSNFQFQWLENGLTLLGNTETIVATPSTSDTTIFYKLIATSPNGCMQMVQINFQLVQPLVIVPNAFSPNGDSVNDVFRMKILEGSATILEMSIYDRWGNKVFSSTETNATWNGKTNDGKDLPSDVYVYYIRWQRGDGALQPPKKGDVTLLR